MATKKKAAMPEPAKVTGFRIRPRYREVACDWFDLEDGEEPFKATIRTNLTFDQIHAIPSGEEVTFPEIWSEIAPHVTAWNLVAENLETGDVEPVPPPAVGGPDAARMLDASLSLWLITQVRMAHIGGPKALEENEETPRKNG